jgi:hypothetical protein
MGGVVRDGVVETCYFEEVGFEFLIWNGKLLTK